MTAWETRGPGIRVNFTPARTDAMMRRLDARTAAAVKARRHLWIATTAYYLTAVPIPDGELLDAENLLMPPMVGCYVCETPYEAAGPTCPGEPREVRLG